MKSIKDMIQEGPVHSRNLDIRTYPARDGKLVVEGRLRDDRFVPRIRLDGTPDTPGVIHNLVIRFLMGDWPPVILAAEAEMLDIPNRLCPETLDIIQEMVGLAVVPGYGKAVQERMGGVKGCTHLTHLAGVMGMAALHGAWTQRGREPHPPPSSVEAFPGIEQFVNSCLLWREDGPILRELRADLEKLQRRAERSGEDE